MKIALRPILLVCAIAALIGCRSVGPNPADSGTPTRHTLTVVAPNGSVSLSPQGPLYETGTVVTLTATASPGYEFIGWGTGLCGVDNPAIITINKPDTVSSRFARVCIKDETALDACFAVRYPNGGETFRVGDSMQILVCQVTGFCDFGQAPLDISTDNGKSWCLLGDGDVEDSVTTWVIPPVIYCDGQARSAISDRCLIRVIKYSSDIYDISDGVFAIKW